jgi:hypothetical protein
LRAAEVVEHLLVRRRLFERVQVFPVDILKERIPQQVVVLGCANDGRDAFQPCCSGGTDTPLPHDDLVALPVGTHHDRLKHANRFDAVGQLLQRLFAEGAAGLAWVGVDAIEWKLLEQGSRCIVGFLFGYLGSRLAVILRIAWDQGFQPTAKAATASHQLAPSPVGSSKPLRSASSKARSR